MKEVQEEVRRMTAGTMMATEDDTEKMYCLKSVIKETLRMYPPIPLMAPPTTVIVNAWATGRDPSLWEDPDDFRPRRFMDAAANIDSKGNNFQFIPFGAGRRGCPGATFAVATIELALTNLLKRFDWGMPFGMNIKDFGYY